MTLVGSRTLLGLIPSLWGLMAQGSPVVEQEADMAMQASPEPGSSSSTGPAAMGCLQVWDVLNLPKLHPAQAAGRGMDREVPTPHPGSCGCKYSRDIAEHMWPLGKIPHSLEDRRLTGAEMCFNVT